MKKLKKNQKVKFHQSGKLKNGTIEEIKNSKYLVTTEEQEKVETINLADIFMIDRFDFKKYWIDEKDIIPMK